MSKNIVIINNQCSIFYSGQGQRYSTSLPAMAARLYFINFIEHYRSVD